MTKFEFCCKHTYVSLLRNHEHIFTKIFLENDNVDRKGMPSRISESLYCKYSIKTFREIELVHFREKLDQSSFVPSSSFVYKD